MPKNKERLFSDDEAMAYIAALENPGKVGWDPAKKVWRTPKEKGYDNNQIAYGLDTRLEHNPIVYNYLKDKGRLDDPWLTDQEAKMLTLQTFNEKRDTFNKAINLTGGNLSLRGYNVLAGMLWHGHPMKAMLSPDSITGKAFRRAIKNGDTDFDDVFDTYYQYGSNKRLFAERIKADAKFRPQSDNTSPFSKQDWSQSEIRIPVKEFKASKPIPTDYSPVRDVPKRYDALNGAGSPTYGGYNPRVPSPLEINARNQQDVWDIFDKGAVALGSKSFLPKVQDLMHEGAKDYVRGILGNASAYDLSNPTLAPFRIPDKFYSKGKDVTRKSLPRFDEGTPTTVGAYNVYPSAVGATGLEITTPEVSVLGKDKRPLYQRYDALNSTYDPNAIRSITDWAPGIGDVSLGFDAVNAFKNQDYMQAGMLGALMFAPNVLKKTINPIIKKGAKYISKFDTPAINGAVWKDIPENPSGDIKETLIANANPSNTGIYDPIKEKFVFSTLLNDRTISALNDITTLYNSPDYRLRLLMENPKFNIYDVEAFKGALFNNLSGVDVVENAPLLISQNGKLVLSGWATGLHNDRGILIIKKASPETAVHEFGHTADNIDLIHTNNKKLAAAPLEEDPYLALPEEQRNRVIVGLADMLKRGLPINDEKAILNYLGLPFSELPSNVVQMLKNFEYKDVVNWFKHGYSVVPFVPAGTALYMGAKDFKQEDLNNAINNLKVLAEGVGYNSGKDIHIKPSKRGTFTAAAKKHNKSVLAFANQVLSNPGKYSKAMRKKALFAKNASKWSH